MRLLLSIAFFSTTAIASTFSTGEPTARWSKQELKVCWINSREDFQYLPAEILKLTGYYKDVGAFTQDEKNAVAATINAEFTSEKTGLHFIGWQDCAYDSKADVYIITASIQYFFYGFAPIGKHHDCMAKLGTGESCEEFPNGPTHVFLSRVQPVKMSALDTLRMYALHEFGHVAGLRHEHIRDESKADAQCLLTDGRSGERMDITTVAFSRYDPSSIMNYCHTKLLHLSSGLIYETSKEGQWLKDPLISTITKKEDSWKVTMRIGLSTGDLHGIQCMYKMSRTEALLNCKRDFDTLGLF